MKVNNNPLKTKFKLGAELLMYVYQGSKAFQRPPDKDFLNLLLNVSTHFLTVMLLDYS